VDDEDLGAFLGRDLEAELDGLPRPRRAVRSDDHALHLPSPLLVAATAADASTVAPDDIDPRFRLTQ
jgi:hypothetical protein